MPKADEIEGQGILDAALRASHRNEPIPRGAALLDNFTMWKTSLVDAAYWSRRLNNNRLFYYASEIIIGLGAASAVTVLPIWKSSPGRPVWLGHSHGQTRIEQVHSGHPR